MTRRVLVPLLVGIGLVTTGPPVSAQGTVEARVTALVGLARTARDQGRVAEAAGLFARADREQPFSGALLVEYFWTSVEAGVPGTDEVGRRALAAQPAARAIRDGLIGWAVRAGLEGRVRELAAEGVRLQPADALWHRRLAEHYLRVGRPADAADAFGRAAALPAGDDSDRAQRALALEAAGNRVAARDAWLAIPEALTARDQAWERSRRRALAPPVLPPPPRPPTPQEHAALQARALERTPCAEEPLAALSALSDPEPLARAVEARPANCGRPAAWITTAVERLIAVGQFERGLALASRVDARTAPIELREQRGVLLLWSGVPAEAEPLLAAVVAAEPGRARATAALVDARRALGDADGAWAVAEPAWTASGDPTDRVILAELALETGRPALALSLARALDHDEIVGRRALAVVGGALLALGHVDEARRVLEPLLPAPGAAKAWLESIAATEGVSAALAAAARLPVDDAPVWTDVRARLARWHAELGQSDTAGRLLEAVSAQAADRGRILRAEVSLALGRPGEALAALEGWAPPAAHALTALALRSTAHAERGEWDAALASLDALRARRPHERVWALRDAEWRHRQAPSPSTLAALEAVAAVAPDIEGQRSLGRAYFRAGLFDRAVAAMGDVHHAGASEADRVLAARSLRAVGRSGEALRLLSARPALTPEALLLRGELEAALHGREAAGAVFRDLVARPDAEPSWYRAWADTQGDVVQTLDVLEAGAQRFPSDAGLQEALAVAANAAGRHGLARAAAHAALALDDSRVPAWFVAIERARAAGMGEVLPLLTRFEAAAADNPAALTGMAEMLAGQTRAADDAAARRALVWMEARLAAAPGDAAAEVARARLHAALGRVEPALAALDALVARRPDLSDALRLRAEILAARGAYAEAVDAFDRYLALAPDDEGARRLQARVEGWSGNYGAAERRYRQLQADRPASAAVAAEAAAKGALYGGRWTEARARYDAWLAIEPDAVEARLERAQLLDRLGEPARARAAFEAVGAELGPNDVASRAAGRIRRRERATADLFATAHSADAAERQQLLDLVDSGVGVADDLGFGPGTRARLFGGPSWARGRGGAWSGYHVGGQLTTALSPALRATGTLAYRQLDRLDAAWFGDAGVMWRVHSSLRLLAGVERALLLENAFTLAEGIRGTGPTAAVRWTPSTDVQLSLSGARHALSDGNRRQTVRLVAAGRVRRGINEIWLHGWSEHQAFGDERAAYFTPGSFWRHDVGAEWRRWLALPRFFGDRERWVSGAYLLGADNRREVYHTARLGLSYELANGVALVGDGQVIRSGVFNGTRLSLGLRLRQVAVPEP